MVKYINRKTIISLLLSGSIALSMTGCGGKIVNMPSSSIATTNQEQTINDYDSIEEIIEESINNQTTFEGSEYHSAVRVLGTHQDEGKANEYDVMISSGIFHYEIFQGENYSIENKDTAKVDLSTVEVNDGQVSNITYCIEDLDSYKGPENPSILIQNQFSPESIEYLKNNSSLKDQLIKEKYMNAIGSASYVTVADNFNELVTVGKGICIDQEGNTVRVEPEEKSKGLN